MHERSIKCLEHGRVLGSRTTTTCLNKGFAQTHVFLRQSWFSWGFVFSVICVLLHSCIHQVSTGETELIGVIFSPVARGGTSGNRDGQQRISASEQPQDSNQRDTDLTWGSCEAHRAEWPAHWCLSVAVCARRACARLRAHDDLWCNQSDSSCTTEHKRQCWVNDELQTWRGVHDTTETFILCKMFWGFFFVSMFLFFS